MALIEWKKEYSIGVTELDRQHKGIVKIVNQALGLQFSRGINEEIGEILDSLEDYIKEHFRTEEAYMQAHQYAGYDVQKQAHDHFIDRLYEARKEYLKSGHVSSMNIFNFVWDWFSQHILILDQQLGKIASK